MNITKEIRPCALMFIFDFLGLASIVTLVPDLIAPDLITLQPGLLPLSAPIVQLVSLKH